MKYAGVVVLYNPDKEVITNVRSYADQIEKLYITDNSDVKNPEVIDSLKALTRTEYIDCRGNHGIAYAQNVAAKKALREGYQWLLTMDQDSRASAKMITVLKDFIEKNDSSRFGIVSAYHKNKWERNINIRREYKQVLETMSSGNMLNLSAYRETGLFKEKLFIDMVDYEYCLRLNKKGYKVIVVNESVLYHNPGNIQQKDNAILYSHNPERFYYYVRNNFYVLHKYNKDFPNWVNERRKFLRELYRKTFLYEDKRAKRLYYFMKGYMHFKRGRYGKL